MKIKEILQPGVNQDLETENLDELLDRVESQCSKFFAQAREHGGWLYRGIQNAPSGIFHARSRQNRKPLHSDEALMNLFDEMLQKAGCTALRSNSIFCSSVSQFASGFGEVYLIFPIDGQHTYTWTQAKDIILDTFAHLKATDTDKWENWQKQFRQAVAASSLSNADQMRWIGYLDSYNPMLKILLALHTQGDVLIKAGVDAQLLDIKSRDFLDQDKFIRNWMPQTKDMAHAMDERKEILINGEYYAFKMSDYGKMIAQHWNMRLS